MKLHDDPLLRHPLLIRDLVFAIGLAKNCQRKAIGTGGWLDDMGDEAKRWPGLGGLLFFLVSAIGGFVGLGPQFLIEIGQVAAAVLDVLFEVIVGAVGHSLQFLRFLGKRKEIFDVGRANRVERP